MNIKKIVSAVSALTMAVSAFAGMATVAIASEYSVPYALSSGEVIRNVYIGGATTADDDGNIVTVASQEFDDEAYADNGAFDSALSLRTSGFTEVDSTKNVYGINKGIAIPIGASSRTVYTMKTNVGSGKVVFRGDILNAQRNEFVEIVGADKDGNEISVFKLRLPNSGYGSVNVYNNGTAVVQSKNSLYERGYGITIRNVVIDLDAETPTVTWAYDGIVASQNNNAAHSGSYTVEGLTTVTGIAFGNESSSKSGTTPTFDNVELYSVGAAPGSNNYTVKAKSGDVELGVVATGTAKSGNEYEVTGLSEVIEKDGVFYVLSESVKNHTVTYTMGDEDAEKVVEYDKADSMVGFYEVENHGVADSTDGKYSNSKYGHFNANNKAKLDTLSSGKYTAIAYLAERGDRGIYIRDNAIGNTSDNILGNANINRNSVAGEYVINFELSKTTDIMITGFSTSNSTVKTNQSAGIDYICVYRTGDYVAPVTAENLGAFEGTDGSKATAFKADLTGVTGKLNMTITPSEGEAKDFEGFTTLSDANVILGIIAENLKDAAATAVITVQ